MILFICMHPTLHFYVCRLLQSMESVIELYIAMQLYMRRVKEKRCGIECFGAYLKSTLPIGSDARRQQERSFWQKRLYCVKNAICCDEYAYNETARNEIRTQYQAKDKLVIGNVGRFSQQKNQMYLVDIFRRYEKSTKTVYYGWWEMANFDHRLWRK